MTTTLEFQEPLFPMPNKGGVDQVGPIPEDQDLDFHRVAMRELLAEALTELDPDLTDDGECIDPVVEQVLIATEGLAQVMARRHGLDANDPAFLSENIASKVVIDNHHGDDGFNWDFANPAWLEASQVDDAFIDYLTAKAESLAEAVVGDYQDQLGSIDAWAKKHVIDYVHLHDAKYAYEPSMEQRDISREAFLQGLRLWRHFIELEDNGNNGENNGNSN